MITDKMLAQAAAELATAINESLPDPKDCTHEFSAEFERKMKRITRRANHPILYRTLRSVASIILVITIGFGSVLVVSAEARAAVFGWVKQQYESFYEYFFEGDITPTESAKYQPGWIPEGCEFVTSYETAGGEVYIYTDAEHTLIQFSYTSEPGNETLFVDGVEYLKEEAIIHDRKGEFYIAQKNDKTNGLIWTDETETVLFFVSGNYDKETLVKIAESVEKNN